MHRVIRVVGAVSGPRCNAYVSEVRLHPDESAEDGHVIELYGELAAILELSAPKNDNTRRVTGGLSFQVVAGVGFEPTTFRL